MVLRRMVKRVEYPSGRHRGAISGDKPGQPSHAGYRIDCRRSRQGFPVLEMTSDYANALISDAKAVLLGLPDFLVQHPFWSAFFVLIIAANASTLFDHYRAYRRRKSQS